MTRYPREQGLWASGTTLALGAIGMPMGIAMALDLKLYLYVGVVPAVALGIVTGALVGCFIGYCVDHVNGFGATLLAALWVLSWAFFLQSSSSTATFMAF